MAMVLSDGTALFLWGMSDRTVHLRFDSEQRSNGTAAFYADLTENLDLDYPVILTNRKSFSELADEYPAIKEAAASRAGENTCVLTPSNFTTDSPEYHYGREMALIVFIIRMEYRLNAVELALKKVYGYSLAARNKAILRTTICSSMAGIAAAWILGRILNLQLGIPLVIAAAVLLLSEILYVFWRVKKTEEKRIISILKGEKL